LSVSLTSPALSPKSRRGELCHHIPSEGRPSSGTFPPGPVQDLMINQYSITK
jgi:hypothetical protein